MANAIGPMSLGLGQFLMIAKQPSKNASSGDWTRIQSTPSKNTMNGLVVGMKHLLMPWRHTCRSKPPSESWPRCLEKPFLQMGWKSPLKPNRLGKAAPKRLGKACQRLGKAWGLGNSGQNCLEKLAGQHGWGCMDVAFSSNVCFLKPMKAIIGILFSKKSSP